MRDEEVGDPVNYGAIKSEAGTYRAAHPQPTIAPSPMPDFQAKQMQLKILAEAVLKRHQAAQAAMLGK
jgi:hypothetical protein